MVVGFSNFLAQLFGVVITNIVQGTNNFFVKFRTLSGFFLYLLACLKFNETMEKPLESQLATLSADIMTPFFMKNYDINNVVRKSIIKFYKF